jgi:hypothetical protein
MRIFVLTATYELRVSRKNHLRDHPRNGVPPFYAADEERLMKCMLQEVNEKFGLHLSVNPSLSRTEGKPGSGKKLFVITTGHSHARRVSESPMSQGEEVVNIAVKKGDLSPVGMRI